MDIIFDLDGTLADCEHRRPLVQAPNRDWKSFLYPTNVAMDAPVVPLIHLAALIERGGGRIIYCTGRPEALRETTRVWLLAWGAPFDGHLFMRKDGDSRPDRVIKKELLEEMRALGYRPKIAVDDRTPIVKMWREAGLICLQCTEGW